MTNWRIQDTLVIESCPSCFINYAIPKDLHDRKQRDGGNWYCPNGHSIVFTDPEVKRLQRALNREQELAMDRFNQLEQERRSHAATKGKLTKTRNRIAKGVCPCCNRSFTNVERHMSTQHPDFQAAR